MHQRTPLETFSMLAPGTAHLFSGNASVVRQQVDDLGARVNGRAFFLFTLSAGIEASSLAEHLVEQLAVTAFALWPDWYEDRIHAPDGEASSIARTALDAAVDRVGTKYRGVNVSWLRDAARAVHRSRLPTVRGVPDTIQIRQLTKAISPTTPVLLLDADWSACADCDALARQIENIARAAEAPVVLLAAGRQLPDPFTRFPLLPNDDSSPTLAGETVTPTCGPIVGRPHPNSEAERTLYHSICGTDDLRGLFSWNQVLHLSPAATPKVDLAWPNGKLVVEIDGWADHCTREKFETDRQRDYELLAAGYVVLRVSNNEVLTDTERVLAKLRRLVRMQTERLRATEKENV